MKRTLGKIKILAFLIILFSLPACVSTNNKIETNPQEIELRVARGLMGFSNVE